MRQSERELYVSPGEKPDYSDARRVSTDELDDAIAWTHDGKLLAEKESGIEILDSDGKTITALPTLSGKPFGCSDGHIVFTRGDLKAITLNIWRSEPDGTGIQQISKGRDDENATCSPDAKWIFYVDRPNRWLMKVPMDGGTPQKVTSSLVEFGGLYDFAPDGKTFVLGTYDFKVQR